MLSTSTRKSITKYEPVNSERRKRQKNASQIHSQNRQSPPLPSAINGGGGAVRTATISSSSASATSVRLQCFTNKKVVYLQQHNNSLGPSALEDCRYQLHTFVGLLNLRLDLDVAGIFERRHHKNFFSILHLDCCLTLYITR
jgi:hypothetical protein